jgi:peptidoglycan L-alanyl-D-glutamate endopeptidase CwlK
MMNYTFGPSSATKLAGCDDSLQRVARRALGYGIMDFAVTEGPRTLEKQQEEFRNGRSQIDGISKLSMHQHQPSKAMDLMPFPAEVNGVNVWKDPQRFSVLAGLVLAAAKEEGVALRWGGDWDGDGNNADSNLHDLPHFELA